MKRGNRGVSIYMETTTAISLDSRCLSRPMGRASRSVPLPAMFECTSGKQTSGSASVWTSWPNLLVMQLASPSRWPATVVASPSGRPRVTPTERTPDMCGYTSWQSGTQLRLPEAKHPRHLPHFLHLSASPADSSFTTALSGQVVSDGCRSRWRNRRQSWRGGLFVWGWHAVGSRGKET